MSVSYLVYVSQAAKGMDKTILDDILSKSRANNSDKAITGILLFVEGRDSNRGSFMQLLEGDKEKINALRDVIFDDPRHHTKVVLEQGSKAARDFKDWSMALKTVKQSELEDHPQFADLADPDFIQKCRKQGAPGTLSFLCEFWDAPK